MRAADISFYCTDALAPAMRQLAPAFETATGHSVKMTVANAGTIASRLEGDASPDLAVVLPAAWDRLKQEGRIDPSMRYVIGKVGLGVFTRQGADRPDVATVDAFKRTVLKAGRLAVRDPAQRSPVGNYILGLFDKLGLGEAIRPKLLLTTHPPYEEVIAGDADLGFSTLAEIAAESRVQLAGPLPAEIQHYNVFVTAVPNGTSQRATVQQFIEFLSSYSSRAVLKASGIDID